MLFLLVKREDLMARTKPATTNGQTQPMEEPTRPEAEPVLIEQRQRIGPAIRQLRQQQGLTLSDLAAKTGISVSYLSRLEKGRSVPSFTLLSRIGQELGVPIGFFVETEQAARHVDDQLVEELSHTPIPKQVWPEILSMSLEGRKALADYLEQQEAPA
jgi:transcriptional regulator with XRE-family HTH domain